MSLEIIQSHSTQIGDVLVTFTVGRIGKTIPEAKASEDNDASVQADGRQADSVAGDASRPSVGGGTDATELPLPTSPETGSAGDPSPTSGQMDLVEAGTGQNCAVLPQEPCTAESQSDGGAIAEVKGKARPADAIGVEPPPSEFSSVRKTVLRPHHANRHNGLANGMNQNLLGMDAVRDRMTLARLAREIGITRGAVAQWDRVPAERLGDVARVTGISMDRLRPDLFQSAEHAAVERLAS